MSALWPRADFCSRDASGYPDVLEERQRDDLSFNSGKSDEDAYGEIEAMVVKRFADRPYVWRTVLPATKAQGKYVVEECLVLSIKELFDKGLLANHSFHMGSWRWADANISQFNGPVRYEADLRNHEKASLRLQYEIDGLPIDYSLHLSAVDLAMFGPRWWFRCPLEDVRVKKLYLPPHARRFASRKAYDLVYPPSRRKRPIEDCHLTVVHVEIIGQPKD